MINENKTKIQVPDIVELRSLTVLYESRLACFKGDVTSIADAFNEIPLVFRSRYPIPPKLIGRFFSPEDEYFYLIWQPKKGLCFSNGDFKMDPFPLLNLNLEEANEIWPFFQDFINESVNNLKKRLNV